MSDGGPITEQVEVIRAKYSPGSTFRNPDVDALLADIDRLRGVLGIESASIVEALNYIESYILNLEDLRA